tara:strand:- start:3887 stop:4048 length:162 start_codon:yes stop_codon:yes gene_type:complete
MAKAKGWQRLFVFFAFQSDNARLLTEQACLFTNKKPEQKYSGERLGVTFIRIN